MRWLFPMMLLLAACMPAKTGVPFARGDLLVSETFERAGGWDTYDLEGFSLQVANGMYHLQSTLIAYAWGLNTDYDLPENVVIEVEVEQLSEEKDNAYGIMCRANVANTGRGYYFLISGDGQYSIRRSDGRSVNALVSFEYSPVIRQGVSKNTIRAVCIDDYLALYVNGELLADVRDNFFHEGHVGLAGALPQTTGAIELHYDNLKIWEGRLGRS